MNGEYDVFEDIKRIRRTAFSMQEIRVSGMSIEEIDRILMKLKAEKLILIETRDGRKYAGSVIMTQVKTVKNPRVLLKRISDKVSMAFVYIEDIIKISYEDS